MDDKNQARLTLALDQASVGGVHREFLTRMPEWVGGPEVLEEARRLSAHAPEASSLWDAIERLEEVYDWLRAYGVDHRVRLDMGEVRGMDYYTGVTFRGVAPGLGWPIVGGGRYNDLLGSFGQSLPASGFGLGIEPALLAQARQGPVPRFQAAEVLVDGCEQPGCLQVVQALRQHGLRVEVDLSATRDVTLFARAQQRAIPRALRCLDHGWQLTDSEGEQTLTTTALWQEVEAWTSST
jgi:ATP phosphoribosyltransferase regulatory subunit